MPAMRYILPLAALGGIVFAFLRWRCYQSLGPGMQYALAAVAALPLVSSGAIHLLRPQVMLPLLPPWAPHPVLLIRATGLPELAGAAGLFLPRFRHAAAAWLAVFMVAIFPANIYVAGTTVQGLAMPGVPARTAMQAAYILLLLTAGYGWPRRD